MKLLKKNNKPVTQENQYLLQEIALTKRALSAAYSNFDNATDPDLIDCYIYQVNSEQKRYKYNCLAPSFEKRYFMFPT